MSLQSRPIPPIPELTAKIARAAFRKGNVYMQMRDVLGTFFTNDQFADLYPADGQPAYTPQQQALLSTAYCLAHAPHLAGWLKAKIYASLSDRLLKALLFGDNQTDGM